MNPRDHLKGDFLVKHLKKIKRNEITYPKGYAIYKMDVIEIIMDTFETERANMLSFGTNLEVLRRLVPNIFREGLDWRVWCNGLSDNELSCVRINRDVFEYYVHTTSKRLVAEGRQYDNLWKIYNRLVMPFSRLEGPISSDYVVDLPEGW